MFLALDKHELGLVGPLKRTKDARDTGGVGMLGEFILIHAVYIAPTLLSLFLSSISSVSAAVTD